MNPRVLDVLHDAADDAALPVGNGVHVRFEGILQEAIDQHRVLGRHPGGALEELPQGIRVVHDLHRPPAQHVRGPDEHGVPDAVGDLESFLDRARRAVRGLGDAQPARQLLEALAILGHIDRIG